MKKKKKILFICTGNACRSQIAEGLLKSLAPEHYEVFSAGSEPSKVHPMSIVVMEEIGIDISQHTSDPISNYLNMKIDTVITVCIVGVSFNASSALDFIAISNLVPRTPQS